jgi:holo-[acyl-carrier protein] synthase
MMNLRTGVDLIEIARVESAIERHGNQFLNRVYTRGELTYCRNIVASQKRWGAVSGM